MDGGSSHMNENQCTFDDQKIGITVLRDNCILDEWGFVPGSSISVEMKANNSSKHSAAVIEMFVHTLSYNTLGVHKSWAPSHCGNQISYSSI
jgi:hypothetical protein